MTAGSGTGRTGHSQGRSPNTATPFVVPTNTLPSAMVGVMNLFPAPNRSRPPAAWELLYNSCARLLASYACSTAGLVFSCAQTMPLLLPFADTAGEVPG